MINQQTTKQQPTLTILKDGTKKWLLNGELHREDGPAIEYADGTKQWLLNDKLHREDGPAVEYPDGTKRWYLNNCEILPCPPNIKAKAIGELVEIKGQLGILFKKNTFVRIHLGEKEMVFAND